MLNLIGCPSGLEGHVRGMKVREERVLADRKLAKAWSLPQAESSSWRGPGR